MRWHSHKLVTFTTVYAVTGGILSAITAASASLLPDVFEMGGILKHRGASHWPYPFFLLALILFITCCLTTSLWPYFAFYLFVGISLHLLEDSLSKSGIPWRHPFGEPKGAGFYITGTGSEKILVLILTTIFLLLAYFRGFLTKEHTAEETKIFLAAFRMLFRF
jgi:inner membrane protein